MEFVVATGDIVLQFLTKIQTGVLEQKKLRNCLPWLEVLIVHFSLTILCIMYTFSHRISPEVNDIKYADDCHKHET